MGVVSQLTALADDEENTTGIATALATLFAQEQTPELKVSILNAITEVGDAASLPLISGGLAPNQPLEVRTATMEAIGAMGDPKAIPLLQGALADPDPDVKEAAADAIQELKDVLTE